MSVLFVACGGDQKGAFVPEVEVYRIVPQDIPVYQEFIGQIHGIRDIAIRARVEGYLEGMYFQEGFPVNKGALLYTIESQPFEEEVAARLSALAEARTNLAKAESDLNRYRPLAEQNAVSQSDLDAAVAKYEAARAGVEAANANLRASKIKLGYTQIKSPIAGIIGKTRAKVGDFVGRDPNPVILNVVSAIDTILVDFFITENQYLTLAREFIGRNDSLNAVKKQKRRTGLELILSDGSVYSEKGAVDFIDRGVDPATGAILVQASFNNPDRLIRPGQFGRIRAPLEEIKGGIMIPQRSVMELQGRYRVYTINDSNKVDLREIEPGQKYQNFWIIEAGLSAGDRVVYEGLQKVRPGATVKPVEKEVALIQQER